MLAPHAAPQGQKEVETSFCPRGAASGAEVFFCRGGGHFEGCGHGCFGQRGHTPALLFRRGGAKSYLSREVAFITAFRPLAASLPSSIMPNLEPVARGRHAEHGRVARTNRVHWASRANMRAYKPGSCRVRGERCWVILQFIYI